MYIYEGAVKLDHYQSLTTDDNQIPSEPVKGDFVSLESVTLSPSFGIVAVDAVIQTCAERKEAKNNQGSHFFL